MIRAPQLCGCVLLAIICTGMTSCLPKPKVTMTHMIEPQVLAPPTADQGAPLAKNPNAVAVRLLNTQSRGEIGRAMLHQESNGELVGDRVWFWSSRPEQFLDTAIQIEAAHNPDVRVVDSAHIPTLAPMLLVWDLESNGTQLVGVVQFQLTGTDGAVTTRVVRLSEQVSGELPANLADASGHLFHRLASEGLSIVTSRR